MSQENVAYNEPQRFEFYNGVPRMMAPARAEHVTVAANIFAELRNYLKLFSVILQKFIKMARFTVHLI